MFLSLRLGVSHVFLHFSYGLIFLCRHLRSIAGLFIIYLFLLVTVLLQGVTV